MALDWEHRMPDPVTIGTLVASALAMAAEATLKGFVGESVKDAYSKLKEKICSWAKHDADALEATPASTARKAVIAEAVDLLPDDEKASLASLADELMMILQPVAAVTGIDVRELEAARIRLRNVVATSGTAIRVGTLKTDDLEIDGLFVGTSLGKT